MSNWNLVDVRGELPEPFDVKHGDYPASIHATTFHARVYDDRGVMVWVHGKRYKKNGELGEREDHKLMWGEAYNGIPIRDLSEANMARVREAVKARIATQRAGLDACEKRLEDFHADA